MENEKLREKANENAEKPDLTVKEVEFDDFLTYHIAEFGRYQWFVLFVLCYEWIITGFVALSPVFVAGVPDHWCDIKTSENMFQPRN